MLFCITLIDPNLQQIGLGFATQNENKINENAVKPQSTRKDLTTDSGENHDKTQKHNSKYSKTNPQITSDTHAKPHYEKLHKI